jgi:2-keto-4-pentenoate hydratase/2-oxohepta-3-ene-1,7-dioic acid hydratase in catechol pathway
VTNTCLPPENNLLTPTQLKVPPYPVVFTKPPDALAGPLDRIPIPPSAHPMLDYEGELTVIISRTGKDIPESAALSHVLGYTAGNDISARNFQLPETSGGQYCYAKSFDGFAPIGPCIVSPEVAADPQRLGLGTRVNEERRQGSGTDDMIWSVAQIIAHLSRGTTLRAGTVIMTGTPSGVGLFMEPRGFLKGGDVVEVEVEGVGSLMNEMVF